MSYGKKPIGLYKEWKIVGEYENITLKGKGVNKIEYHQPSGEGDAHYCDIFYDDGTVRRIFNPDEVTFR